MIRKLTIIGLISAVIAVNSVKTALAVSAAEASAHDYVITLSVIRDLQIMMDNFGTAEQKKKFDEIKTGFRNAAEKHYAQEFQRPPVLSEETKPDNNAQYSTEMFFQLKTKLNELYEDVSKQYLQRSRGILDSTSVQTNEILFAYGRNTGLFKYFYRPVDPLTEKKPYAAANYHYFHDKETLERLLNRGYRSLQDAENFAANPDFAYLKSKKIKTQEDMDTILETYGNIIKLCRQAKQLGIEIHKLLKVSELGNIQRKYNITAGTIRKYPVYDDRIPEDYKIDIIDNQKLVYTLECERIGYKPQQPSQTPAPAAK